MVRNKRFSSNDVREVLNIGDLLGEQELALKTYTDGGTIRDFYSALVSRENIPNAESILGIGKEKTSGYSICKLIAAQADRNANIATRERDLSAYIMDKSGAVPHGDFVPFGVLGHRDFNAGSATEAGNTIGADRLGQYAGDPIRKVFTLAQLGATFFTGLKATAGVPVFSSSTDAAHLSEIGSSTNIAEQTRLVTLTPRRLSVVFIMSRQALIQSTPELEIATRRQMGAAVDEAMLRGILVGDGTGQNPTGILYDSAVNVIVGGTDGATLSFQHLVNMEDGPVAANIPVGSPGWIVNSNTRKYLRTKAKGTNLPFILGDDSKILGADVTANNLLPSNITKGTGSNLSGLIYSNRWEELLVGVYGGGFDVTVDRVTLADVGKLRVIVSLEYGFGLRYPTAFSVMKDAALV